MKYPSQSADDHPIEPAHVRLQHSQSMGSRKLIRILLWVSCLMPASSLGQTISPRKVLGRYQEHIWQDKQGLPQNSITSIVRTRDGYLWLGTMEGLARFDGVRFTVFDSNNTAEIRSNLITALLEDHEGNLWIGTQGGGLNRLTHGRLTSYTTREGLSHDHLTCLFEDRAGNIWIGTEGGGLNRLHEGHFTVYTTREGLPDDHVEALTQDAGGGLWVGTRRGLARLKDGRFTVWTTREGLVHDSVRAVYQDRAGNLWVGTNGGGLNRFKDGRFIRYGAKEGLTPSPVQTFYQDREGSLWVGTWGGGLFRLKDGHFTPYTARQGLAGDRVRTIYQDPEGDLWVGTEGAGLIQLRDGRFGTYTTQDGLPNNQATTVYEDAGGSIWVGTAEGLSQFRNGAFTVYTTKDGLPSNFITSICEDRQGSLWFSTNGGISRFKDGRFTTWTHKEGLSNDRIFAVLADRAGNLWIGTYGGGLNRFRDGHFSVYTTRDGLANNDVLSLFEDRLGSIWIGTLWGGLSRFKDGRFTTWTTKDGLASNHVLSFYEDRAGNLWIGTHGGGLNRFKDGKFATIKTKDGLYDNLAFRIMEDDGGDLWMSGNKGIYRASLKELNDFAEGRITLVNSFSYDESDGMLSRECNGGQPAGCKMRDGRLWFPTVNGVVVVDPRRHNLKPPLVAIEQVILDRETLPAGVAVRIRPGEDDLEVQYTGLSWNRPGQVKFKFQMVGLDRDWVSAGTRRTAYYSHLAPGRYTFRVIADNGDGVWDMGGASLPLVVLPPFYRTWWFIMLALSGVAAALSLIWRLRVAQLERAHTAQQAFARQLIASQESERKRIATELHDSLGQRLVVIKNLALMFLHAPGDNGQTRARIEEISTEASQAIGEVKEISYNLRPYQLDRIGLTKAVEALAKTASAASEVAFSVELDDIDDIFPQESQINFYRIVQESVNNIVKHSQAKQASVRVRRNGERLLLAIRDDGKGFTPGVTHSEPRQGGFGLIGISERAQLLGGKTVIQSAPGQGTAISIEIDSGVLHRGR